MNSTQKILAIVAIIIVAVGGYVFVNNKNSASKQEADKQVAIVKKTVIMVSPGGETYAQLFKGFEQELRETYPMSADTLEIVFKDSAGKKDVLKTMITEAVAAKPAIIVTASSPPTLQALDETKESKIPILSVLGDPTKHGYIPSLQSSGTNLTGIAQQSIELTPKRFEILNKMFPKVKRVAVFYDTTCGPTKEARPIGNEVAKKLGFTVVEFPLTNPTNEQVVEALKAINAKDFDSLIFYPHGTLFAKSEHFLKKAREEKLPLIMPDESSLASGAVASYGPDFFNTGKQLTRLAIKVLNGVDPKDIPLEQAEDIKFVISMRSLKAIGVEVPSEVLDKVDKVIGLE